MTDPKPASPEKIEEVREKDNAEPTKAERSKPDVLDDIHTPADFQARVGHFAKIVKHKDDDLVGEFVVVVADAPDDKNVTVRLHRAAGSLISVPYDSLVAESPYGPKI